VLQVVQQLVGILAAVMVDMVLEMVHGVAAGALVVIKAVANFQQVIQVAATELQAHVVAAVAAGVAELLVCHVVLAQFILVVEGVGELEYLDKELLALVAQEVLAVPPVAAVAVVVAELLEVVEVLLLTVLPVVVTAELMVAAVAVALVVVVVVGVMVLLVLSVSSGVVAALVEPRHSHQPMLALNFLD
jgi:hypothetical protein